MQPRDSKLGSAQQIAALLTLQWDPHYGCAIHSAYAELRTDCTRRRTMSTNGLVIAIVGATEAVGEEMRTVLAERNSQSTDSTRIRAFGRSDRGIQR